MKATEAIKQLQDIVTDNGDLDLWVEDADTQCLLPINAFKFIPIGGCVLQSHIEGLTPGYSKHRHNMENYPCKL